MLQSQASSQFSDQYPSSAFEDNPRDTFSFFTSDGLFNLDGRETPTSTPNVNLLRPAIPPVIPETLERVGPPKRKNYILWTEMANEDFIVWWLKTEYGSKMKRNIFEGRRNAECWDHFYQVATIQDGSPKVICKNCDHILAHPADKRRGTSTMNRHYSQVGTCRRGPTQSQDIRKAIKNGAYLSSRKASFTPQAWMERLITFIAASRLPFQLIEHPEFRALLEMARLAPCFPEIPTATTVRRHLQEIVEERQYTLLQKLPNSAKLSIALDCWTSPFRQAFMAITGYFIDQEWNYRELLLGFEPLQGSHTGAYLSTVLLDLLEKHRITERVLTITTDNASNNGTLLGSLQEVVESLQLPSSIPVIRIPCIAHVIQLSLKELLGQMDANPGNEREEIEWTEKGHIARQENRKIVDTLNKVRKVAVYINKSPQRRESFIRLQTKEPKLMPIQDVRTRWNSTFLMLRRARRLQSAFDDFCVQFNLADVKIDRDKWRQVDYLLSITYPFFKFTSSLSATTDVTIHNVFGIYNALFTHIDKAKVQLARKKVGWKRVMKSALDRARDKLTEYYGKTDDIPGDLYAIATILGPRNKLEFFTTSEWEPHWGPRYKQSLEAYIQPYRQRYEEAQSTSTLQPTIQDVSDIDILLRPTVSLQSNVTAPDELTRYLRSSTVEATPLVFWKEHQNEYPILASLARDILTTPASGSGVERLFNSARDICHYRRGSLKPQTIKELMLFMCTTKFDVESEQLALVDEYLSTQEKQAKKEQKDAQKKEEQFDPISDNEEDLSTTEDSAETIQLPSARALGKRRATPDQLFELDDDDDEVPLPDNSHLEEGRTTQRRSSGRVPKRLRQDEDFVYL
ncbi:uncharacterized protein N7496_000165 [Penicillium cataractarum]|uniref:BED-type domain-containing protein n=1 Tax=Penicillium cataractarum TaxID=2100454 RepID=A0A9W9RQJ1_9EURO|nr:uncharacterized protein N7496_012450 [Penicillium cataractarum]XP_056551085.1 uncharacterized protein N7496_009171 [Penicillium cataractarum]XP_056552187.1 uncharacterized protein N7496_010274 [Penicillium cataractarum]XP_056552419.1 uncharacterized protein N7496_010506 [Penicillium cataractarum]XP_056552617.1 uncharacterized protein N7496_010704 [Penicillium cataractarum]XP_056553225.1 uncharacterized protein N7496_008243 [Penicillium cataractarum]XP_056557143.1 uncharacterized protein N7